MAHSIWQLNAAGSAASLSFGPLGGRVQLSEVGRGLEHVTWRGASCSAFHVLQANVASDTQLVDSYVRGQDLVANFSQSPSRDVAPHFYWRARTFPLVDAVGIEIVISVQTSLLDSRPEAMLQSHVTGAGLWHASRLKATAFAECGHNRILSDGDSAIHLVVLRCDQPGVSYAEMVHPSDFESGKLSSSSQDIHTRYQLFQKPLLEKGVIRRARICGWFMPAENDLAVAVELARQFIDEPLPLTT